MEKEQVKKITTRLDVMINLMMRDLKVEGKGMTDAEKIRMLNDMGLKYTEIAEIMGKTPTNISVVLAKLKKKK